jgi:hypothetical protein
VAAHTSNPGYACYLSTDIQGCCALCLDKCSNISQVLCTNIFPILCMHIFFLFSSFLSYLLKAKFFGIFGLEGILGSESQHCISVYVPLDHQRSTTK